jgi:hypothetical protein
MSDARPDSVDLLPERRPGVPKERAPHPAIDVSSDWPAQQPVHERILLREGLAEPPPVFGTAQPPRGVSGAIRKLAYALPESLVRHWMLLLLADRVESFGQRLRRPSTWVTLAAMGGGAVWLRGRWRHPGRA